MSEPILTPVAYGNEVAYQAGQLVADAEYHADANDDPEHPEAHLLVAVVDTLDGHTWLDPTQHSAAFYGAMIDHAKADPHRYRDLTTLTDNDEPHQIVRNLAAAHFEADVVEGAREFLAEREVMDRV